MKPIFRKGYCSQLCLLVMIKKFKEAVGNSNEFGALLTDLSNTFDCIDLPVLLAKRYGYGVSHTLLKPIFSYFESRTQRTKINNCFRKSSKTDYDVPQASMLGSLFFNINLMDIFYECEDSNIENYAYDTKPFTCALATDTVIS